MEIKHLKFFKRVAELQHITKAAEALGITQPFLSKTIADLESELGVVLFDHKGRRIELNEYGKTFYRTVTKLDTLLADGVQELHDMSDQQDMHLTLLTNVSLYLPELLGQVNRSTPELTITQQSVRRKRMTQMLLEGRADFGICCPPIEEDGLESCTLMHEKGVIIYPEGHWLEGRGCIPIGELLEESFVSVAPGYGTRDAVKAALAANRLSLAIAIETTDTASVLAFVKNGLGIAIASLSVVQKDPYFRDHYCTTEPLLFSSVGLSWRQDAYQSLACRIFADEAKRYFEKL